MIPDVIVITGPTATGKTELGIRLARKLNGEVVSADSMQVYRYMDIGTAKPTKEEMGGIAHHMIDVADPWESYSAARYVSEATHCVDDIISRSRIPILVGGTGLYIDSLILGRNFAESGKRSDLRIELSQRYDRLGGESMLGELAEVDTESASRLHPNDKKRVVRALEVYKLTGLTISQHNKRTREMPPRYKALKIALGFEDRADLYSRVDTRVDKMMEAGLENEVRSLIEHDIGGECTSMQAIGYKEMILALSGKMDMGEAVEMIKMESRRYAKRQMSWLRRDKEVKWILWGKFPDFEVSERISTEFLDNLRYY